jgi:hypothetical protein
MSRRPTPTDLGEADLKVGRFQLWVHGREFPEAVDDDDGNRLRVTAHARPRGASVWTQGAIPMVTDIAGFGEACAAMLRGHSRLAALDPLEPELKVSLEATGRIGHLRARLEITPDHLWQSHRMEFDLNRSHLPGIIGQCSAIVQKYPIRGLPDREAL